MAPVWEANHVWLIFVLTVTWTAYPKAFGSLASTLSVALLIAGIGIIFRGAAYALRAGARGREQRAIDTVFGISSMVSPFALGAAAGGIASGRVPVGNAAGGLFSSWLNPTSILIGALAVLTGAYLAAVFLSGDAVRVNDRDLAETFRARALDRRRGGRRRRDRRLLRHPQRRASAVPRPGVRTRAAGGDRLRARRSEHARAGLGSPL